MESYRCNKKMNHEMYGLIHGTILLLKIYYPFIIKIVFHVGLLMFNYCRSWIGTRFPIICQPFGSSCAVDKRSRTDASWLVRTYGSRHEFGVCIDDLHGYMILK